MENFQENFITSHKKFSRCPFIYEKPIIDEVVLVHQPTGNTYELNPSGTAIWQYCSEGRTFDEILDFVSNNYQIEKPSLEQEISTYLQELIREGILEIQQ